jgi:hypothetical protein
MRVAVIIPTLDDDAALQRQLARVARLDPAADEVIVVDGAASQACELVCRAAGAIWVPMHGAWGGQLALGAARARADVLWFLHLDCEPHTAAVGAIRRSIAEGAVGGFFRFRFAGPATRLKRMLERCIAWRSRWGLAYGDQALFITQAAYAATPGFAIQPLFEEVAMVQALKRTARFAAVALPITVATRRWERDGYLWRALLDRMLVVGFLCGIAPARLVRWDRGHARPAAAGHRPNRGRSQTGGHEAHKG